MALGDKGDLDGAVDEYRANLRLQPANAKAHADLGGILDKKGDIEEAIAEYREAVRLKPKDANAHYGAGWARARKLELGPAIEEFREAVTLKPEFAEAHCSAGYVFWLMGRRSGGAWYPVRSIEAYREALRMRPDFVEAHYGLGMALLEQARQSQDSTKERFDVNEEGRDLTDRAIAEFRSALLLRPEFGEAHFGIGWALDFKDDLGGSIAEYREDLRLMPDFAYGHVRLGRRRESGAPIACVLSSRSAHLATDRPGTVASDNSGYRRLQQRLPVHRWPPIHPELSHRFRQGCFRTTREFAALYLGNATSQRE
jgi:tetratricopeptide (TPR) repeat protein